VRNRQRAERVRSGNPRPVGPTAAFPRERCLLLAIGSFALLQTIGAAHAQSCNLNVTPVAPTVANINVNGASYTPQNPLDDGQAGLAGCDGGPGGPGQTGGTGLPGVPGPSFTATYQNVTVTGVIGQVAFPAVITASGGASGDGGDSGSVDNASVDGGPAYPGASGGQVSVSFSGSIEPANADGLLGGLNVLALGGDGGDGGGTGPDGIYGKDAGFAGGGGGGGTATLNMTGGTVQAQVAVAVSARGGDGGNGGAATTSDLLDEAQGGAGGDGGGGGAASASIAAGVTLEDATDVLLSVVADGGNAGDGGLATGVDPLNGYKPVPTIGATGL